MPQLYQEVKCIKPYRVNETLVYLCVNKINLNWFSSLFIYCNWIASDAKWDFNTKNNTMHTVKVV